MTVVTSLREYHLSLKKATKPHNKKTHLSQLQPWSWFMQCTVLHLCTLTYKSDQNEWESVASWTKELHSSQPAPWDPLTFEHEFPPAVRGFCSLLLHCPPSQQVFALSVKDSVVRATHPILPEVLVRNPCCVQKSSPTSLGALQEWFGFKDLQRSREKIQFWNTAESFL